VKNVECSLNDRVGPKYKLYCSDVSSASAAALREVRLVEDVFCHEKLAEISPENFENRCATTGKRLEGEQELAVDRGQPLPVITHLTVALGLPYFARD
jgi:hypothetical protein